MKHPMPVAFRSGEAAARALAPIKTALLIALWLAAACVVGSAQSAGAAPQAPGKANSDARQLAKLHEHEDDLEFDLAVFFIASPEGSLAYMFQLQSRFAGGASAEELRACQESIEKALLPETAAARKRIEEAPAFKSRPAWLKNLAYNLSRVPSLSARLFTAQYRGQAVYYLTSSVQSALYDERGTPLCAPEFLGEKIDTTYTCPGFDADQKEKLLLWQKARQEKQ